MSKRRPTVDDTGNTGGKLRYHEDHQVRDNRGASRRDTALMQAQAEPDDGAVPARSPRHGHDLTPPPMVIPPGASPHDLLTRSDVKGWFDELWVHIGKVGDRASANGTLHAVAIKPEVIAAAAAQIEADRGGVLDQLGDDVSTLQRDAIWLKRIAAVVAPLVLAYALFLYRANDALRDRLTESIRDREAELAKRDVADAVLTEQVRQLTVWIAAVAAIRPKE